MNIVIYIVNILHDVHFIIDYNPNNFSTIFLHWQPFILSSFVFPGFVIRISSLIIQLFMSSIHNSTRSDFDEQHLVTSHAPLLVVTHPHPLFLLASPLHPSYTKLLYKTTYFYSRWLGIKHLTNVFTTEVLRW